MTEEGTVGVKIAGTLAVAIKNILSISLGVQFLESQVGWITSLSDLEIW